MTKQCDLKVFFNEFNFEIKRKFYGINSFNGFINPKSYNQHLKQVLDNFRYDMFFVLPSDKDVDKKVFLRKLFTELNKKKSRLERISVKEIYTPNKEICSLNEKSKGVKNLILKIKNVNFRRITFMY